MTKKKIIEILKTYGIIIDSNEIADELLTLFKQELLERLEQLHTEMDERLREEVAIEKRMGEKKAEKLIEQEKKELARDIFSFLTRLAVDNPQWRVIRLWLESAAKEYGVEL